ncbi:trypsin-like peptidase domain-containing protein [bacterium]|nr:trypsin-like peptidase domain-containing protein [bacterium]
MNINKIALSLVMGIALVSSSISPSYSENVSEPQSQGRATFAVMQDHIMKLSDQIKDVVVHIEVVSKSGSQRRKATGSGLIINADGKIVTNYHVIDKAQTITVTLNDKSKYTAEIVRSDQQTDLAFLKIKADHKLPFAKLADSDKVRVGEWVIAVGNPYGFDRTVSFGIVSGKGRFVPGADNGVPLINDFIQIDALIDAGNSGGPLVNMDGEVIGINSIGVGRGQGFTIPSNIVIDVENRKQVEGRIQRGWLGIFMQPFTDEYAEYIGRPDMHGLLISDVMPGSPAAKYGLRSGDIVTKFNGHDINANNTENMNRVKLQVAQLLPGDKVPVEYYRDGKSHQIEIVLALQPMVSVEDVNTDYGFVANEITLNMQMEHRLEDTEGMLVSKVEKGSVASTAGLAVGDVINFVNKDKITNTSDLNKALEKVKNSRHFLLTVKRGKINHYVLIDTSNENKADNADK